MSYDIRFAVKGEPSGRMYVVFEPEYAHPTYNIGTMLRKAMNWDFVQGEWYKVSDIMDSIKKGIYELSHHEIEYEKYSPDNGWGSVEGALKCLENLVDTVKEHLNGWYWNDYDIQYLWMSW